MFFFLISFIQSYIAVCGNIWQNKCVQRHLIFRYQLFFLINCLTNMITLLMRLLFFVYVDIWSLSICLRLKLFNPEQVSEEYL